MKSFSQGKLDVVFFVGKRFSKALTWKLFPIVKLFKSHSRSDITGALVKFRNFLHLRRPRKTLEEGIVI